MQLHSLHSDRIDTGKIEPSMPSFTRPAKMASTSGADTLNDALPAADWQRRSAALDERQRKLRDAEKVLLVERWKKEWEYRRPPRPNWHALAGKDFTLEAEKHRRITRDEGRPSAAVALCVLM